MALVIVPGSFTPSFGLSGQAFVATKEFLTQSLYNVERSPGFFIFQENILHLQYDIAVATDTHLQKP